MTYIFFVDDDHTLAEECGVLLRNAGCELEPTQERIGACNDFQKNQEQRQYLGGG